MLTRLLPSPPPGNTLTKVFYIGCPKEQALLAIDIDERLLYNYVDNLINNNTNEIIFVDKNMDIITHQDKSLLGTKLLSGHWQNYDHALIYPASCRNYCLLTRIFLFQEVIKTH